MKKAAYSFLLLEFLIALTLITMCVLPFTSLPFNSVKKELASLQKMELQAFSNRTFAQIKEKIYKKEISWEQLCEPEERKALILEKSIKLPIKEWQEQTFKMSCYAYSTGKQGQNKEDHRLVTIELCFKKNKKSTRFRRQLFITKNN